MTFSKEKELDFIKESIQFFGIETVSIICQKTTSELEKLQNKNEKKIKSEDNELEIEEEHSWIDFFLDEKKLPDKYIISEDANCLHLNFKTLLNAKKKFWDTKNIVVLIICNLSCSVKDNFLHVENKNSEDTLNNECLNATFFLSFSSSGIKFKPLFFLKNINFQKKLYENDKIEHIQQISDWFEQVFQKEIVKNNIDRCICLVENELWAENEDLKKKLNDFDSDVLLMTDSIANKLSPFRTSLIYKLNGILHKLYLESNLLPFNLQSMLENFKDAWSLLSKEDIIDSFKKLD